MSLSREDQALLNAFEADGVVMPALTQDEIAVLMIAAEGEPMMPIGRWEKPVEALVSKGFLKGHPSAQDPTGRHNCYITDAGRQALQSEEAETDKALAATLNKFGARATAQKQMIDEVTKAAESLARAAVIAKAATDDSLNQAMKNCLNLLKQKLNEMGYG